MSTPHNYCFDTTANISASFVTDLSALLDSLSKNVSIHNGFYTATMGSNSSTIYGLMQCRGDISPQNCSKCVLNIVEHSREHCPSSTDSACMLPECFLRYSIKNFFGENEDVVSGSSVTNVTEDPGVVAKGNAFMRNLASTTPRQPRMFQESILDVSQMGKRRGIAQCRRDLNSSTCGKCLNNLIEKYEPNYEGKRFWELYSFGCSVWYKDLNASLEWTSVNQTPSTGNLSNSYPDSHSIASAQFRLSYVLLILGILLAL